jgi:hypothetical protein
MQVNHKKLLIALAILAAVILYVKFVDPRMATTAHSIRLGKKIFDLPAAGYFQLFDCPNIAMQKKGPDAPWMLTKPYVFPCDENELSVLEDLVKNLSFVRDFAEEELDPGSAEQFGLGKTSPIMTFSYRSLNGEPLKSSIIFGADTPVGNECYVKMPETDKIFTVSRELKKKIQNPFSFFAVKTVFRNTGIERCKKFSINTENAKYVFSREADGEHLLMREPCLGFIDAGFMKGIFPLLENIKIIGFTDRPSDIPEKESISWDSGSEVNELIFEKSADDRLFSAAIKGYVPCFNLAKEDIRKIEDKLDLRNILSPTITPFAETGVEAIELKIRSSGIKILNNGKDWSYGIEKGMIKSPYRPLSLAKNLLRIKIREYKEKEKLGTELLDYAGLKVILKEGKQREFIITISTGKDGKVYSSLDGKMFGLIDDIDMRFLYNLEKGEAVKEKDSETAEGGK